MKGNKIVLALSLLLVALVAFVSIVGITNPATYAQETPNWQAQSKGQDWADLLLAMPMLLVSAIALFIGNKKAIYTWGGSLSFLLYTFTIYCFNIHFTSLFFFYCVILGLSFYLFMYFLYEHIKYHVINGFADIKEAKLVGIYFIGIAVLFYALWLGQIIPPIKTGQLPAEMRETGLITNPVHVIDLSVCLPAFFITGVLLLRRADLGFALAPAILTFSLLMDFNLAGLMYYMQSQGVGGNMGLTVAMGIMGIVSAVLLYYTLKNIKFDEQFK